MNDYKITISNSHVNNKEELDDVSVINLLQDVEGVHINNLGTFTNYFRDNNLGVFLVYRYVEIVRRPKFGETVILDTYPYETKRTNGYRHIYIYDENRKPLVKCTAFGSYVDLLTNRIVRLPEEIVSTVNNRDKDLSIKDYGRKIDYEITENKLINEVVIRKSHIDRYNHVNNAHYLSFVLDGVDKLDYNEVRMTYHMSFYLNDIVRVYLNTQPNGNKVALLKGKDEEIHAIMEFIRN